MMKRVDLWQRDSHAPQNLAKYRVLDSYKLTVLLGCPSQSLVKKAILYRLVTATGLGTLFIGLSTVNGRLFVCDMKP